MDRSSLGLGRKAKEMGGMMDKISAVRLIREEYDRATDKFGKFHNAHEGWGVLREEYLELEAEIMKKNRDVDQMRKEATQLGAMALRFMVDVT